MRVRKLPSTILQSYIPNDRQLLAMELREKKGMTFREIALEMNISIPRAHSLYTSYLQKEHKRALLLQRATDSEKAGLYREIVAYQEQRDKIEKETCAAR